MLATSLTTPELYDPAALMQAAIAESDEAIRAAEQDRPEDAERLLAHADVLAARADQFLAAEHRQALAEQQRQALAAWHVLPEPPGLWPSLPDDSLWPDWCGLGPRGELLDVKEVAQVWADEAGRVKSRLLSIPSRIAPTLLRANELRDVELHLQDSLNQVLDELSAEPASAGAQARPTAPAEDDAQAEPTAPARKARQHSRKAA
ncbi:hypothetical protein Thiowin_02347 [Thiorhodovibrio winogradskyi]|uniref:Uncharacterized protein n=1 Tax=Thiorhodovibrio winogradskyi TaxID=77007 RepID=A0ABZ0S9M5_9GAMM|nr:hypothetical protein [Thiorhodovibrio winogradskyi]